MEGPNPDVGLYSRKVGMIVPLTAKNSVTLQPAFPKQVTRILEPVLTTKRNFLVLVGHVEAAG